ncbi:hypothetical protein OF846_003889 [Rhodotorula toruloides]|nr:hypothetical protein OF846_003889 [Rhodotorula toruloides]
MSSSIPARDISSGAASSSNLALRHMSGMLVARMLIPTRREAMPSMREKPVFQITAAAMMTNRLLRASPKRWTIAPSKPRS